MTPLTLRQGAHVVVTLAGNRRYEGILVGATGTPDVSLAIRNARSLDTPAAPPVPTLLVLAKDLLQLDALDVNLRPPPPDRVAFKTDTDITGAPPTTRGKPLEAWSGEDYTLGNDALESNHKSSNSTQNWDQFATNERLYGVRTDYNEDAYTTKLDRTGSNFRQREQKAAQLEREILRVRHIVLSALLELTTCDRVHRITTSSLATLTWQRSEDSSTTVDWTKRIG